MKNIFRTALPILAMLLAGCTTGAPPPAPTGLGQPTPTFQPPPGSTGAPVESIPGAGTEPAPGSQDPLDGLNFRNGWARIPFNFSVFGGYGADQMNDVVAGGPGVVAVGFEVRTGEIDGAAWYSPDGIGWYRVIGDAELGGPGVQNINSVAAGANGLVAVGMEKFGEDENAAVWFSSDGMRWTRIRPEGDVFGDSSSQVMEAVTAFAGGYAAVGVEKTGSEVRGAVWTSPDGRSWERSPHSEAVFGGVERFTTLRAIAPAGDALVAVGTSEPVDDLDVDAAAWISRDGGASWSPVEVPEAALGDPGPVRFQLVSDLVMAPGGLFMVATEQNIAGSPSGEFVNALILHSSDGTGWERIYDHKPDLYRQGMDAIIAAAPGLFAAGYEVIGEESQAAVWFSEDGTTWSQVPFSDIVFGGPGIQRITSMAELGSLIVAVGTTTENGEQDGAAWIYSP